PVQEEVQRQEVGQLVALHRPRDHALEVAGHARRGDLLDEDGIVPWLEGDEAHIRGVALVPRPGMGKLDETDPAPTRLPSFRTSIPPSPHTSTTSTHGSTTCLSMRARQSATISSGFGPPP